MRDWVSKANATAPLTSGNLDAGEFNSLATELERLTTAGGLTLDNAVGPDTSTEMIAESLTLHVGAALACSDLSSTVNRYVLRQDGPFVAPSSIMPEMRLRFRPGASNTGQVYVDALGLGPYPLLDHALAPLVGGELLTGRDAEIIFRRDIGMAGAWVLPAWSNAHYVTLTPAATTELGDGEGWSVDVPASTGNLNFPGLRNDAVLDDDDLFARYVDGVGHRTVEGDALRAALAAEMGCGFLGMQVLTATGTYTKTVGALGALVFATGGGGGGGGNAAGSAGSGGGAGETVLAVVDLTGITTVPVTIGAAGARGAAGGGAGGDGGITSFDTHARAHGGKGGTGVNGIHSRAGTGGVGGTGLMPMPGNHGGPANQVNGGAGGDSFWGGGGIHGALSNTAGGDAVSYGGGGGGAFGATASLGGLGAAGLVVVIEFCAPILSSVTAAPPASTFQPSPSVSGVPTVPDRIVTLSATILSPSISGSYVLTGRVFTSFGLEQALYEILPFGEGDNVIMRIDVPASLGILAGDYLEFLSPSVVAYAPYATPVTLQVRVRR
ncbi:MAG: hypothetical protein KA226_09550, partial [Gemmatimonadales bacterium]|nr:hypothetical protein [Gemmatimonadales bacterium]